MRRHQIHVLHNKAVCEFYKSGLVNTGCLRKVLTDIIGQNGSGKGHGRLPEWPGSAETSVAVFNLAVVSYHQQHFTQAIDLLSPLHAALDALEESVGISVCLLLARCYLRCHRADNALTVVAHTEVTFLPQPLLQESPPSTPTQQPRDRSTVGSSSGSANTRAVCSDDPSTYEALRRRLQLLRVRCFTELGFLKHADKEFRAVLQQAASAGNDLELSQICIKSQLKCLRSQHLKAIKSLNNCAAIPRSPGKPTTPSQNSGSCPNLHVWFYNNLAVIHAGKNNPALAVLYLEKAYDAHMIELAARSKKVPLYDSGSWVGAAVSYNIGCLLLRINNCSDMARKAFDLFTDALQTYTNNPRLWLHLAQCCVAVHRWSLLEHTTGRKGVTVTTLGCGTARKLLIRPHRSMVMGSFSNEAPSDAAFPEPRLQFGRLCCRNALKLLPASSANDESDGYGVPPEVYPCPPSLSVRGEEAVRVRRAVLCFASYTNLNLSLYREALDYATQLLTELADTTALHPSQAFYRFLANMYAANCCVMLDKFTEAMQYLVPQEIVEKDDVIEPHTLHTPLMPGHVTVLQTDQRCVLQCNMIVVFALRQEFDKAAALLDTVWRVYPVVTPPMLSMLAVYLNIRRGLTTDARRIVETQLQH